MPSSRSAFLILHGKSAFQDDVRAAVHTIRDEGCHIEVRVTWEPGDATRFARQAAEADCERVVVGGGDGTINEVVNGLAEAAGTAQDAKITTTLGIVPLGTANDLANACGIPLEPVDALRLAVTGPSTLVDVGRVNGKHFLNLATGGFGAEVTTETPGELKNVLGKIAYLISAVTRFTSIRTARGKLTGPDLSWEGSFLVLAVGNGRQAGGGYLLCPEAHLDDGLLDVRIVPELPAGEFAAALGTVLTQGLDAVIRNRVGARVSKLRVETEEPLQINLDGEPMTNTRFQFEILPRYLPMVLPADCPLLVGQPQER